MECVLRHQEVTLLGPIPLQMRTAIVLYKLASCAEYRVVANQFGEHKATVKKFVYVFCKGMVSTVIDKLIKVPSKEEAFTISANVQHASDHWMHRRNSCSAFTAKRWHKNFVNRKGWPFFVLQPVVDDTNR